MQKQFLGAPINLDSVSCAVRVQNEHVVTAAGLRKISHSSNETEFC